MSLVVVSHKYFEYTIGILNESELLIFDTENISQVRKKADPIAIVQALRESARRRCKSQLESVLVPASTNQLPLWPESVRAVPNGFLRTALFGVIAKGRRRYIKGENIAAVDGVTIYYKGERLDQEDLNVWESVLHAVRFHGLGRQCHITSYALLKLMDKTDTGKNRTILQNRIERLKANALTVDGIHYTYIGSLIRFAVKDKKTQQWIIELDERLIELFADDQFTQLNWSVRRTLNGQQLAQWLHGFYSSHARPFPLKVETLHRLCGSKTVLISDFAKNLRKSLNAVAEASTVHGQVFNYDIRNNLVHVEKGTKRSQQRHLEKSKPLLERLTRDTVLATP